MSGTSRIASGFIPTISTSAGQCTDLLVDDWSSQLRLTFLFYNAMLQPSSDDGTMKSVTVANNRVTLTRKDASSYFYTMFGCISAIDRYGGLGMNIKAAAGATFQVEIQASASCDSSDSSKPISNVLTSNQLGWTFAGSEDYYTVPFSKFPGLDLGHLTSIVFSNFEDAVTFGSIAFYCGNTGSAYPVPSSSSVIEPSSTAPATTGPSAFVMDAFASTDRNA
ncbi:MAG: hypothetical protein M1830_001365, partial [Pleopsidium flavum]